MSGMLEEYGQAILHIFVGVLVIGALFWSLVHFGSRYISDPAKESYQNNESYYAKEETFRPVISAVDSKAKKMDNNGYLIRTKTIAYGFVDINSYLNAFAKRYGSNIKVNLSLVDKKSSPVSVALYKPGCYQLYAKAFNNGVSARVPVTIIIESK